MTTNSKIFKIYGAYNWNNVDENKKKSKNNLTVLAFKELIKQLEVRIKQSFKDSNTKLRYNHLRATAGSYLLDGIRDRIIASKANFALNLTKKKPSNIKTCSYNYWCKVIETFSFKNNLSGKTTEEAKNNFKSLIK